jgi:mannosyl-3-phosphoglycerate synthase
MTEYTAAFAPAEHFQKAGLASHQNYKGVSMIDIHNVRLSHLWRSDELAALQPFLRNAAFVISHKSESPKTLWRVIRYLPADSAIVVVTNCPLDDFEHLKQELKTHLHTHRRLFIIHQKDSAIADLFSQHGVQQIIDEEGKVRSGKGEGMYIGALFALALKTPQWVVFFDADNHAPTVLLAYILAMGRLFTHDERRGLLHNVRICWLSKHGLETADLNAETVGRCTRVVSPVFSELVQDWFGVEHTIISSNAGEQGMNIAALRELRFSSGYSVESLQLLDLLYNAYCLNGQVRLDQYFSQSAFFHTKKDDSHVNRMIADSLGAFLVFEEHLPASVKMQMQAICQERDFELQSPITYPCPGEVETIFDGLELTHYQLKNLVVAR